jgi:hypothetical protein
MSQDKVQSVEFTLANNALTANVDQSIFKSLFIEYQAQLHVNILPNSTGRQRSLLPIGQTVVMLTI